MSGNVECLEGTRYRMSYHELSNMYLVVTDESFDICISDPDIKSRTLVGLGIISKLVTLCLAEGVDPEIIASDIWSESRNKNDLADIISRKLIGLE